MEDVLKFQKFLMKDYYKSFVIKVEDDREDAHKFYYAVNYRGEVYLELEQNEINISTDILITDCKEVYLSALSEIILKLSSLQSNENKIDYLRYIIQLFQIPFKQLMNDVEVDNIKSRYYATSEERYDVKSFKDHGVTEFFQDKQDYYPLDSSIWLQEKRMLCLTRLPFSLYTIAGVFLNILQKKHDEIEQDIFFNKKDSSKLTWEGKPAHLGFVIGTLNDLGYIKAPVKSNGEINYTQFSKEVYNTFNIETTPTTLAKYLNPSDNKNQESKRKFEKEGFDIPHKNRVS